MEFDESKVINCLHVDKAEIGKKYWVADNILSLKNLVENNEVDVVHEITSVLNSVRFPFFAKGSYWALLYPCEEPPKQRMTNRQLSEWLAKGNGELTKDNFRYTFILHEYYKGYEDEDVEEGYLIRPFGQTEWIEPTLDVYMRDCK